MKKLIVSGKGGSGKTTFVKQFLDYLTIKSKQHKRYRILLIDADPAATLHLKFDFDNSGIEPTGEIDLDENNTSKLAEEFLANHVKKVDINGVKIDYAYMGHHTKNSCLCGYNHSLNEIFKEIQNNYNDKYDLIVMDREAGVEHISRSVYGRGDDILIVVSWPTPDYISVAKEIFDLADILGTTSKRFIVFNDILSTDLTEESAQQIALTNNIDATTLLMHNEKLDKITDFTKLEPIIYNT